MIWAWIIPGVSFLRKDNCVTDFYCLFELYERVTQLKKLQWKRLQSKTVTKKRDGDADGEWKEEGGKGGGGGGEIQREEGNKNM